MPTLKSKNRSESDFIRYVNLYKDDIENIIQIMKEGSDYVNISDNKYNYESDVDYKENFDKKSNQIKIEAHGPSNNNFTVSCDCKDEYIYLHTFSSNPQSRDIYRNVKDYIESKYSFWLKFFRSWIKIPIMIASLLLLFILFPLTGMSVRFKHYSITPVFIFLDIIITYLFIYSAKDERPCKIYLQHDRGETFIFGKSKQEFMYDVMKMFIATAIGSALGSMVTLLINK